MRARRGKTKRSIANRKKKKKKRRRGMERIRR